MSKSHDEAAVNQPVDGSAPRRSFAQRLLSGAAWIAVGRIASVGAAFLTQLVLARAMEKPQYGAYGVATTGFLPILITLVGFGCPQILTRDIRRRIYSDRPSDVYTAVRSCALLFLCSSVVLAALFVPLAPMLSDAEEWAALKHHAAGLVALACASGAGVMAAFALQGMDEFRTAILVGSRRGGLLPNILFFAAVTCIWLAIDDVSLGVALALQALFAASVLPLGWFAIQRRIAKAVADSPQSKDQSEFTLTYFIRESWPCMLSQLALLSVMGLDVVWVAAFSSGDSVADYNAVKHIVRVVEAPYLMFVVAMAPFTAELLEKRELDRLQRLLRGSTTAVGVPVLVVCAIFLLLPETVIRWTFGADFVGASQVLQILAVGQAIRVLMGPVGQALTMAGFQRTNMLLTVGTLAVYLIAAPQAIEHYGGVGAATAYSLWIVSQGILGAVVVRARLGIWTVATTSGKDLRVVVEKLKMKKSRGANSTVDKT